MNSVVNFVVRNENHSTGVSNYAKSLMNYFKIHNTTFRIITTCCVIPKCVVLLCRFFRIDAVKLFETIPLFLKLPKEGVIHFTEQQQAFSLLFKKRNAIVTVHDLVYLATDDEPFFRRLLLRLAFQGLKKANLLIADSEYTKKDIIRFLKYPAEKIWVIPLGVDHDYFKPAKIKRDKFTVLYVGSEMPRKNLITP